MSEAAATFVHHRVFVDQYTKDPFFKRTRYVFNDHTPLDYAHPEYTKEELDLLGVNPIYYNRRVMNIWKYIKGERRHKVDFHSTYD